MKDSDLQIERITGSGPGGQHRNFGDETECVCGHPYECHFDSYEDMAPVGCKYCDCDKFQLGS